MGLGRYFFRVIESDDGTWVVRRGSHELARYDHREDAVAHARAVAAQQPPSEVFVHTLDGDVRSVAAFEPQEFGEQPRTIASPT